MRNLYNYRKTALLALLPLLVACSKKEEVQPASDLNTQAEIEQYSIAGQQPTITIDKAAKVISLVFASTVTKADNLVANFTLSEGATARQGSTVQVSGQTANNFEMPIVYTVTAEDGKTKKDWRVKAANNDYTDKWGLGSFLKLQKSNNRNYSWYYDQGNTGTYSAINCGPTSTTMVAKWSDASFSKTPLDARAAYRASGGWWYTTDIVNYLNDHKIPNRYINLQTSVAGTQQSIKDELDNGNVLVLCLDAYYISEGSSNKEHRTGKFYNTNAPGWGHFIVAKGYKVVDGKFYFEVYDPFSFGQSYPDGTIKGQNRYYLSEDIFQATNVWWNYAIVVTDKIKTGRYSSPAVPATDVPAQHGR